MGLLLLRAAVGILLIAQSSYVLVNGFDSTVSVWVLTLIVASSGLSLLVGFMTPVGSVMSALVVAGIALNWLPQDVLSVFQNKLGASLVAAMAVALALLGPGAYSIDSRLFGRREIVISSSSEVLRPVPRSGYFAQRRKW